MKRWLFSIVAVVLGAVGCTSQTEQSSTPTESRSSQSAPVQPVKLTPEQELAKFCRVCVVDKDEKIEEFFPSRLDTQHSGKTYKFCSDDCKKKFDVNSSRYAVK
jgi:hypothetical protein